MSGIVERLSENANRVFQHVDEVCQRLGRERSDVLIVAVSKYADLEHTRMLAECLVPIVRQHGQRLALGENRPQVLEQKIAGWVQGPDVDWHYIGPLQSNKIGKVAPFTTLLHSVDRLDLLNKLERYAAQEALRLSVLLEVNISGEFNKHGFELENLSQVLDAMAALQHVVPLGLMGMSGLESDADQRLHQFQQLAAIGEHMKGQLPSNLSAGFHQLSMGMSGDLEQALQAGSTIVRIGSAFWEGVL